LSELSLTEVDKHPEKRMKAAWNAFLDKKLPEYKSQYPNFTRNKLIDMIQKEFKKSTENPVYMQQVINSKNEINIKK
jgi:hypothetical protein